MKLQLGRSFGSSNTILLTDKDVDPHGYIAQLNLKGSIASTFTDKEKETLMLAVAEKIKEIVQSKTVTILT